MKTACVYHSIDLDGWMSAAIVKLWANELVNSLDDVKVDFFGYNYNQLIPDLSEYEKVIMCDISFPIAEMEKLYLKSPVRKSLVWIDHHVSAILDWEKLRIEAGILYPDGLLDVKFSACELTWKYFFPTKEMPECVRLLGRYDCFGHKNTPEETIVLEFQYAARTYYHNMDECYTLLCYNIDHPNLYIERCDVNWLLGAGKGIYQSMISEAKLAYRNKFNIEFVYPSSTINTVRFLCINKERLNPVNFGIDYHKQGYDGAACFHYNGSKWAFSLYNDNGLVDCSVIAKSLGGGGHKGAAGFIVDDIEKFINEHKVI